jgi:hypothetical protein
MWTLLADLEVIRLQWAVHVHVYPSGSFAPVGDHLDQYGASRC